MQVEHVRDHAAYCLARMHAAPDAASRRRWAAECADWLSIEQERTAKRDSDRPPAAMREARTFR